jgi:DNA-binding transcriptional LysR family regulator
MGCSPHWRSQIHLTIEISTQKRYPADSVFGTRFCLRAKEVVAAFDRLREDAQKEVHGQTGRLRVGFGSYTPELVPRLIVKLRAVAPSLEISLRAISTTEQIVALRSDLLDIGFTRLPLPPSARDFEMLPVVASHLALVSPCRAHRPRRISLDDCRDQPLSCFRRTARRASTT